jgi:hypothetical protein
LCPIIYLNYFWCIKYQHINIYMKMGKRNGKRKKEKEFSTNWAGGGGISAQPTHEERGRRGGRRGPMRQREERGDDVRGGGGGRSTAGENRSPVNPTVVPRRWSGSEWMERWQSTSGGGGSWRWSQFASGCLWWPVHGGWRAPRW